MIILIIAMNVKKVSPIMMQFGNIQKLRGIKTFDKTKDLLVNE
jgi:hypothetical protein